MRSRRIAAVAAFSLVELMIVVALMAVVALGMSQMFVSQSRQQAAIQRKANYQQLALTVQAAASNASIILGSMSQSTCACTSGQPCNSSGQCPGAGAPAQ